MHGSCATLGYDGYFVDGFRMKDAAWFAVVRCCSLGIVRRSCATSRRSQTYSPRMMARDQEPKLWENHIPLMFLRKVSFFSFDLLFPCSSSSFFFLFFLHSSTTFVNLLPSVYDCTERTSKILRETFVGEESSKAKRSATCATREKSEDTRCNAMRPSGLSGSRTGPEEEKDGRCAGFSLGKIGA